MSISVAVNQWMQQTYNPGASGISSLGDIDDLGVEFFAAESNVTNDTPGTTNLVSRWNDVSGNGKHVTASATDRPTLSLGTGPNGTDELLFNGSNTMANTSFANLQTEDAFTIFWVARAHFTDGDTTKGFFSIADNTAGEFNRGVQCTIEGLGSVTVRPRLYNGTSPNFDDVAQTGASYSIDGIVHCLRYSSAEGVLQYYQNNTLIAEETTGIGDVTNACTRLRIGSAGILAGTYGLTGAYSAFSMYRRSLTDEECTNVYDYYANIYGFNAIPTLNFLVCGDSMTADGGFGFTTWTELMEDTYGTWFTRTNLAVSGDSIDDQIADANATNYYDAGSTLNYCIILAGYNDIVGDGDTPAQAFANIQTWVADRVSEGWDKIFVATIPTNGSSDPDITTFNDLITDTTGVDYIVLDLDAFTITLQGDNVHPTQNGHYEMTARLRYLVDRDVYGRLSVDYPTTNLILRLAADSAKNELDTAVETTVAMARDLTGSDYDFIQEIKTLQPTYDETLGMYFDDERFMETATTTGFLQNITGGHGAFVVTFDSVYTGTAVRYLLQTAEGTGTTTNRATWTVNGTTSGRKNRFYGSINDGTETNKLGSTSANNNERTVQETNFDYSADTVDMWMDDVDVGTHTAVWGTTGATPNTAPENITLGNRNDGNQPLVGWLKDVVIYDAVLTSGNRAIVGYEHRHRKYV